MTVPEDWRKVDLGNVARVNRGLTWSRSQESAQPSSDSVPVLRIPNIQQSLDLSDILYVNGVNDQKRSKHLAQKGWSIMVGSNGNPDRVGNCVFMSEDTAFLFASFLLGIETIDHNRLTPEFLYRLISGSQVQKSISQSVQGSTGLRNISLRVLRSEQVLLPPLPEQKKIAAILSSVDETIQATRETIEQTKKVKQGLMQELLTRGIGHTRFKKTEIGEIPEEWSIKHLGELCQSKPEYGANSSKAAHNPDWPRYIRITDIDDMGNLSPEVVSIPPDTLRKYQLFDNDIVIARTGATVGKSYKYNPSDGVCVFAGYLIRFRIAEAKANADYLAQYLHTSKYWNWIAGIAREGAQPNINAKEYSTLPIAFPPLYEQKKITDILSSLDANMQSAEKGLCQLQLLKKGLMQDLLTGKVRVAV